jgi:hypothetical protein
MPLQNDWYVGHWQVPATQYWPPGHVVVQGPPPLPLLDPPPELLLAPLLPPDPVLDPLLEPEPPLPLPPEPLLLLPWLLPLDDELPHAAATPIAAASARPRPSELRMFASLRPFILDPCTTLSIGHPTCQG